MNFVAFETSSDCLSVAVAHGDVITSEDVADTAQKNSELALPLMHQLLKAASLSLNDIDVVAYGRGPGSFTGIRIACGLAQGLAFGLGKPVIGVASTLVLAAQAHAKMNNQIDKIVVAIDARMGEIYFAVYQPDESTDSGFAEIVAPMLIKPDQLPGIVAEWGSSGTVVGIGSAFADFGLRAALLAGLGALPIAIVAPALPQATALLAIAKRLMGRIGAAATHHPRDAAPIYLRNNVAMTIEERRQFHAAKQSAMQDAADAENAA